MNITCENYESSTHFSWLFKFRMVTARIVGSGYHSKIQGTVSGACGIASTFSTSLSTAKYKFRQPGCDHAVLNNGFRLPENKHDCASLEITSENAI